MWTWIPMEEPFSGRRAWPRWLRRAPCAPNLLQLLGAVSALLFPTFADVSILVTFEAFVTGVPVLASMPLGAAGCHRGAGRSSGAIEKLLDEPELLLRLSSERPADGEWHMKAILAASLTSLQAELLRAIGALTDPHFAEECPHGELWTCW